MTRGFVFRHVARLLAVRYAWSALDWRRSFSHASQTELERAVQPIHSDIQKLLNPLGLRSGKVAVPGFGVAGYLAEIEFHE